MRMAKIAKGLSSAVVSFAVVGVAFPYLLEYFSPQISSYVHLPPPDDVWGVFIAIGAMFALTSFLQNAYAKGEFPWLFGKLGSGVVTLALYIYLYSLLPSTLGSTGIQYSDLLYLIVLAVVLSYGYLIFDFMDARRKLNAGRAATADVKVPTASALGGS
jgi:hypothetical protein